jgi:hypothetical protein
MILDYDGKSWNFDRDAITIDEWRQLKKIYKMTPGVWQGAVAEADPDASTFLYWLMLRQAGNQQATLGDHLRPDIIALNHALAEANEAEAEAEAQAAAEGEAEPDPTAQPPPSPSPASPSPPAAPSPPPAAPEGVTAPTAS